MGTYPKPVRSVLLRAEIDRWAKAAVRQEEKVVKETKKDSSNLLFGQRELLARVDNDRELLHDLLTIFKEEFPRYLQALRVAVDAGDGKLVAVAAHALKATACLAGLGDA
jgi:hypothetical protein